MNSTFSNRIIIDTALLVASVFPAVKINYHQANTYQFVRRRVTVSKVTKHSGNPYADAECLRRTAVFRRYVCFWWLQLRSTERGGAAKLYLFARRYSTSSRREEEPRQPSRRSRTRIQLAALFGVGATPFGASCLADSRTRPVHRAGPHYGSL
jgi:hypothetical protein